MTIRCGPCRSIANFYLSDNSSFLLIVLCLQEERTLRSYTLLRILLYYFGMVTIGGTYMGDTKFVIPNEVVREQIFSYLLETYKDNDLSF